MTKTLRSFIYAGALACTFLFLLAGPASAQCYTYSSDLRYCNVVKIKNGVCVHNRWGQYHDGQFGPSCPYCYDTVNNDLDFLVSHYETPLEEGCYPYNDCQVGTVYTCLY